MNRADNNINRSVFSYGRKIFGWLFLLMLVIILLWPVEAPAQCAMCNETARTSTSGSQEKANALNNGILFLMIIPYVLLTTLVILWIMVRRSARRDAEEAEKAS